MRHRSAKSNDAQLSLTRLFGFTDIAAPCASLPSTINPTPPVCADPDHTFFWDVEHPTEFGHAFFAVTVENTQPNAAYSALTSSRHSCGIPTKREAQHILDDVLCRTNSGEHRPQAVLTFRSFVEDRWKPDVYPTLKFSSQKFYTNMIDAHLIPVFGDTQLRLITKDAVQSFLNAKTKSGSSWKTVKHIRTAFGTIIEAAVRDDLLISNPVRKTRFPRRGPAEESLEISPATIQTILEKLPERSRAIATLLAATGLRIGELLALR